MNSPVTLAGSTILVVEDEPIIAFGLEDLLSAVGAQTLIAGSLEEADTMLRQGGFDAAILDVNVNGENSYTLAEGLMDANMPFIFATGYGGSLHPPQFAGVPTIAKPYTMNDVEQAFAQLG